MDHADDGQFQVSYITMSTYDEQLNKLIHQIRNLKSTKQFIEHNEILKICTVWSAVASMGWYIVAILISLWYASPYIREKYINWKMKKEEQEYAAKYHKNPDLLQQRLSAVEASRQKMQQEYYEKCTLTQKDREERAERKREASRLADAQSGVLGHRLGTEADDRLPFPKGKPNTMKKEYNPLMGDNSRGYRPPKRSCCGKGGCG